MPQTEGPQPDDALRQRIAEATCLNKLSHQISTILSIDEVIRVALGEVAECVGPDLALLFLRDGRDLILRGVHRHNDETGHEFIPVHRVGECLCGLAIKEVRPIYSLDIHRDSRCTWEECKKAGFRSFAALPMRCGKIVLGVLGLASRGDEREFERQAAFLETLANAVAVALRNAQLYEELQRHSAELARANEALRAEVANRKAFERALRDSEVRHRTILDQMQEGVIFADAQDTIRLINRCASGLLGAGRHEVEGRDVLSFHTEPVRSVLRDILRSFREGRSREAVTLRRSIRDREMVLRISPVQGPDGSYRGIITNIIDLTDQIRMQQQMAEARRMETVGTLAGGVAHDFNNLMQTVLGGASHLKTKRLADHPDYEVLVQIERAASTAGKLAHQLLVYAKGGKILPRRVSFAEVVSRAIDGFRPSLPKDVQLSCRIVGDVGEVECDTTQIEQVIGNLCRNAVDAMPHGGRLAVETQAATLAVSLEDTNPPLPAGDYVCVTVRDTGCGMDSETAKRAFDPFFTTKADGHGLGLAAAWGIVKSHNGGISLTTRAGAGAAFQVWLPRVPADAQ